MADIEYIVYFNNESATQEELDRIDEITVEQETDMAWEARIQIPIQTDEQGNWQGEDDDFMEAFSRVRVEIRNRTDEFVPLIDGPVVETSSARSSEPGRSTITLIVRDDSVLLDEEETLSRFDGMLDHEIAESIFGDYEEINETDVEETEASGNTLTQYVFQRGTAMQLLRFLARRQGFHAYVLPGENPGESVGCFKPYPTEVSDLPPLILLGPERNMESFNVRNNAQGPSSVMASVLGITDKQVTTSTSSFDDLDFLGTETPSENGTARSVRRLPPYVGDSVNLDNAVRAEAADLCYSYEANGTVIGYCYTGILRPYQIISIGGTSGRHSGSHLITKVTHTLTRSQYTQTFTVRRNALSADFGEDGLSIPGGLF